jgi:integrase
MAQLIKRLSDRTVQNASPKGRISRFLPDGAGLYLQVSPTGTKSWVFRYSVKGRERYMGLGPFPDVSLADARAVANDCRKLRREGIDPIDARRAVRAQDGLEAAKTRTFKECAGEYIKDHRAGWRNERHAAQWISTLETYAYPVIGDLSVQSIDTGLVIKVLKQEVRDAPDKPSAPFWMSRSETASRLRGRIESIIDWAKARGYRAGENPARWKGHLDQLLPARSKVRKVEHHPALPYGELPGFMEALRARKGIGPRALEFSILTVARSGETLGARWPEVDLAEKVWIVPKERMKGGREHRVPLSEAALKILEEMKAGRDDEAGYVFPGTSLAKPILNMTLAAVIRRMNEEAEESKTPRWMDPRRGKEAVPHGFRSTFRDWAAERTSFPNEMVEMALAHAIDNKVEAAYRRGDLFDKRRRLMEAWASYCGLAARKADTVVPLRAAIG